MRGEEEAGGYMEEERANRVWQTVIMCTFFLRLLIGNYYVEVDSVCNKIANGKLNTVVSVERNILQALTI